MKVNEALIAEWLKHKCLWDVKARAYKDRNTRENAFRTLAKLFGIILHSQGFTKTVPRFFCSVFFLFKIIAMAIAVAASSSLITFSVEIEIQQFK